MSRKTVFHQRQVQVLVAAVEFVAHYGMAQVREVDSDLVFAPGVGNDAEEGESTVAG